MSILSTEIERDVSRVEPEGTGVKVLPQLVFGDGISCVVVVADEVQSAERETRRRKTCGGR